MSLKNLIIKGKFFQLSNEGATIDSQVEHFKRMKKIVYQYLYDSGYDQISPQPTTYNYAIMEFYQAIVKSPESKGKFSSRLFGNKQETRNNYLKQLENIKDSSAWHVTICCYPNVIDGKKTIIVEITSEPAIIHKYQQLKYQPSLTQDDIDLIIYENQEFISRLATAVFLNPLTEPTPLGTFVKTNISTKLRAFGFEKTANLYDKGRDEIEHGKTENGLVDLRSTLEQFLVEIIQHRNGTPANPDKIKININEIKDLGIIDDEMAKLLVEVLVHGVYSNLSNTTHSRESVDLFDARLYFDLVEKIFDFLLEKGVKYRI